jgi:hypothetical protein
MSEIPFVELLGDELESAARRAATAPAPRRRRRFVVFGLAGALVLSGTAAATGVFSGADEQRAALPVSCYAQADSKVGPVIVDSAPETTEIGALSAVAVCRRDLARAGKPVARLVACAGPANVAVVPGRAAADCTAAGFAGLSAGYARARGRTEQLEHEILRIEASADCIAPAEIARQLQALLDRLGWSGWTTQLHGPADRPCGTVSSLGGGGQRSFGGSLDAAGRHVLISRTASRRLTDLLFSRSGMMAPLFDASGARCFTVEALRAHVDRVFGAKGVHAALRARSFAFPRGSTLSDVDGRMTRYRQGCAIVSDAEPGSDDRSVVIDAWIKP